MSWEPFGFMFFSGIEAFSLYFLTMCLFRFRFQEHIAQAFILTLLVNLQSYILRNDFALGNFMPIITIFFFVLFFAIIVRMPLVFSVIATISGYVIFGVVQCLLALLLFGSLEEARATLANGYVLQASTGILIMALSWLGFRLGYGFTFDMNRLRFKFEDIMVVLLIAVFLVTVSIVLYFNELSIVTLFFVATSAYLLYYAMRKDRES
ncbi:hypothetical protein [Paenibacillus sp. FSL R10-2771]|uniref:hypothetical protein n=1 Tax=Paenibacillus sp. FSL R10-2771 TaxID=2954693 RepID=UPI0030F4D54E